MGEAMKWARSVVVLQGRPCGAVRLSTRGMRVAACGMAAATVLVLAGGCSRGSSGRPGASIDPALSNDPAQAASNKKFVEKLLACQAANNSVRDHLLNKLAGTFTDCAMGRYEYGYEFSDDDQTVTVTGYVNALNSVNQEVRSKYSVELAVTPGVGSAGPTFKVRKLTVF